MTYIRLKRAYDPKEASDGFRIYVDRLWPRGLSHETFSYDLWDKKIAPSDALREWFHHTPGASWGEFARRYKAELEANPDLDNLVKTVETHDTVTLLFSSKDTAHNNAVELSKVLADKMK